MVSINRPRFEDSDFESRDKSVILHDAIDTLDISERGRELLLYVNEVLDNMSETPSNGASASILFRFPGQADESDRLSADEQS